MRSTRNKILLAIALLFMLVVLVDALGVFDSAPYTEVTHGDHVHFVPKDRDPEASLDHFPTTRPRSNERITPTGEVVPVR